MTRRILGQRITCLICNKSFLPYSKLTKFCSLQCRSKNSRIINSEYIQKYRENYRDTNRDNINAKYAHYHETEAYKDKKRIYSKEYKRKLKEQTFLAYGGIICVCPHGPSICGVDLLDWLTLDHIDPKIKKHKIGGHELYKQLEKEKYPSGYRVLCYNCNCSRGHMGKCPLSDEIMIEVHKKYIYENNAINNLS